ncbi:1-aminocyclopropane-1-carboxylate deaminase/D-cysteine desulfhydrase [Epilithonimonas arachidiradicis]|uniref:1-aminocyclopropane-1-carboxylate deaminase n=1 Tax=Epilithonimonas arachidiradicis TaxID=1617282 RepID=A0A420DBQ8_9FLAO|nr:pyridoxal-phosphate dependent enzyme [Epilithonimonas arachidiradicis]RKE88901.1 1-aminocyclopropane-1-carboxylate deaminase/D-cysteine desulfhydrase-like pyridoxal-dependent ACC family enzyme [Epilithonimonas arachidiradicis]GGG54192.1 1-aminocyclopropane-1-carboxylate deaminase [Epilithonimonas arachidiradicis]
MLQIPEHNIPIVEIKTDFDVQIFIKREDLIHPKISGNKFWKLFFNVNQYLENKPENPLLITFGGAFSNHIASVAAFGKQFNIPTIGIIRGNELENNWQDNPTLSEASKNGMQFFFVPREDYQNKEKLTQKFSEKYPNSLIIPEGGSNEMAVEGVQYMLGNDTKDFDYLCTAVGTGGTIAGISRFAEEHQKVIGIKVVKDDSLGKMIQEWSRRNNFELIDADEKRYGKITDENIRFINWFYNEYHIPLDPIYTGKIMQKIFDLAEKSFFPKGSKILAFHTGGLQGIKGANQFLKSKGRELIAE